MAVATVGRSAHVYTLIGFGRDYDRRPTEFLAPFPSNRVCCVCGVVPDKTALLACRNVLCRTCYDKSLEADDGTCPLHVGTKIDVEDIEWRPLSFKEVSKKKVRCWNAMNGCPVEIELLEMSEHWYTSCQFHNIVCIKCKSRVLQKDIVQHIREGCASNILPRTQDTSGGSESGEHVGSSGGVPQSQRFDVATIATSDVVRALNNLLGEKLASLQNKIQEHVTYERKQCEMVFTQCLDGAKLDTLAAMKDHVIEANNAQNDVCSQLKEDIMNIGHGIREQLEATTKDNVQAMEQLQDLMAKESEKTLRISRKTLEFASSVPNCHEWVVRGWAEMKTKALAQGEAWDFSQPRYFCGYLLKPAVLVYRDEESELKVHAGLELRKGSNDDYLEWPFCKSCRLTFVHPRVRPTARSLTLTPDAETFSELGKPEGGVNGAAVFSAGNYCHARDLENEGYVSADEIRIRFEVMF